MKMLKFYLPIAMILLLSGGTMAAGLSTKVDHSKEIMELRDKESKDVRRFNNKHHERINWDDELKLNESQKIYFKKIMQESSEQIGAQMEIIKNAHAAIDKIHDEDNAKMRRVLNPQQQTKFDKILYRWKKTNGQKPDGERPSLKRMRQF